MKPVTGSTDTQVHVKDSTAIHYIDSVRITEATRYKDLAWLGDTLKIDGQRSRMWAVADTTRDALIGGLEEDKVEVKTRIIYKDKLVYKDSIRVEEKPVPYPVVEYKTPKWCWYSLIFNIVGLLLTGFGIYLKIKRR